MNWTLQENKPTWTPLRLMILAAMPLALVIFMTQKPGKHLPLEMSALPAWLGTGFTAWLAFRPSSGRTWPVFVVLVVAGLALGVDIGALIRGALDLGWI